MYLHFLNTYKRFIKRQLSSNKYLFCSDTTRVAKNKVLNTRLIDLSEKQNSIVILNNKPRHLQ